MKKGEREKARGQKKTVLSLSRKEREREIERGGGGDT